MTPEEIKICTSTNFNKSRRHIAGGVAEIQRGVAEIQRGMAAVLQKAECIEAALVKIVERNKPHADLTKLYFPVCQKMAGWIQRKQL